MATSSIFTTPTFTSKNSMDSLLSALEKAEKLAAEHRTSGSNRQSLESAENIKEIIEKNR